MPAARARKSTFTWPYELGQRVTYLKIENCVVTGFSIDAGGNQWVSIQWANNGSINDKTVALDTLSLEEKR